MKKLTERFIRPAGRVTDILPIAALLTFILTLFGQLLGELITLMPAVTAFFDRLTGNPDITEFMMMYFGFIGIWIVTFLVVLVFPKNRPMLKALGPNRRGNNPGGALYGLLLGFCTNGFCILMSWLMGDIKLSWYGFQPLLLFMFLVVVCIQSGAEEIMTRMYLYQKLRRRYRSPLVAILANAVLFASLHLANPGFTLLAATQIFLIGAILALLVYYYDSLWAAIMFHTGWNYTQNLIFGLPNSGLVSAYSMFRLEAASARSGLFYNAAFGVEGSVGACAVLALVGLVILLKNRNSPERIDLWKEADEAAMAAAAENAAE